MIRLRDDCEYQQLMEIAGVDGAVVGRNAHADEELLIVKEGTVEALVNGEWVKLGAGSIIFQASCIDHAIRNAGETPATYHVIKWNSPGMLKQLAEAKAAVKAAAPAAK